MKLLYTTADQRMTVELTADTQQDLWKELARFQETFEVGPARAKINKEVVESNDVRFRVRTDKEQNEYFELMVMSGPLRYYKVSMGQMKKGGGLYPKYPPKDDPNTQYGYGYWHKFVGTKSDTKTAKDVPSDDSPADDTPF